MVPLALSLLPPALTPCDTPPRFGRRSALAGAVTAATAAAATATATATAADAQTPRIVFVAGATGRTGRRVLDALRADDAALDAIAGVRTAAAAAKLPPGVSSVVCDLESGDALATLSKTLISRSVSDVVCTVGFSPTFLPEQDRERAYAVDYLATLTLIDAARAASLRGRFILVSSLGVGATVASPSARLLDESLGGVLRQKAHAEAALAASGLDWTIVRPGLLQLDKSQGGVLLGPAGRWVGDAQADRVPGLAAGASCASPFLASSGAVCAATRQQVAQVCVAALLERPVAVVAAGAARVAEAEAEGLGRTTDARWWSRRVVEVVARPEVPAGAMQFVVS